VDLKKTRSSTKTKYVSGTFNANDKERVKEVTNISKDIVIERKEIKSETNMLLQLQTATLKSFMSDENEELNLSETQKIIRKAFFDKRRNRQITRDERFKINKILEQLGNQIDWIFASAWLTKENSKRS